MTTSAASAVRAITNDLERDRSRSVLVGGSVIDPLEWLDVIRIDIKTGRNKTRRESIIDWPARMREGSFHRIVREHETGPCGGPPVPVRAPTKKARELDSKKKDFHFGNIDIVLDESMSHAQSWAASGVDWPSLPCPKPLEKLAYQGGIRRKRPNRATGGPIFERPKPARSLRRSGDNLFDFNSVRRRGNKSGNQGIQSRRPALFWMSAFVSLKKSRETRSDRIKRPSSRRWHRANSRRLSWGMANAQRSNTP